MIESTETPVASNKSNNTKNPLELRDIVVIENTDGKEIDFEVVGLVEDDEDACFAVCYSEAADEFVITDVVGNLIKDNELAQEILDDFFVLADESTPETQ
jgi:hypothetical protein